MKIRLATPDDDAAIARLLESGHMPGALRLAFSCRPSFFESLRVAGHSPVVVVAEDGDGVAGLGVVARRWIYLNGRPAEMRYLAGLRVAPRARGSFVLVRGFEFLDRELSKHPADITLTSILDGNAEALSVLAGGRASLPPYGRWRDCVTRVIDTRGRISSCHAVTVADADELASFFATHGPGRNGFPLCKSADLKGSADSCFPGLQADGFHVLRNLSGEISAVLGCWDTRSFRQTRVGGYPFFVRILRPWFNVVSGMIGVPRLPAPNRTVPLVFITLPLVVSNDPCEFRMLLDAARAWARQRGVDYLVCSLPADDALAGAFAGLPHREIHSTIFRVRFRHAFPEQDPDDRPAHFEAAML